MKITVLVPSERYVETAGVRIRYRRISKPLAELGWSLDIVPIDNVPDLSAEDKRIFLFSKCQDARAMAVAVAAKRAGISVGVDLFDDYFSQVHDSRFAGQRLWLESIAKQASFFLCSTPRMLDVGYMYFGSGAGHVLRDPHEEFDPVGLEQELAEKSRKAKRERRIPIVWFGIPNNPNFPVGLHDLSAFGEALRPFLDNSYKADLTIVTNRESIDALALERLRRIPIPFVIRQWTKEREDEALSRSLVSFLPVNFQQFSIGKSQNRGVTALVGGTQLLTAGYPLYDDLGDYAYHDAVSLLDDLENSKLKLSPERVREFADWISGRAAPAAEATSLVKFLETKVRSPEDQEDQGHQWAVLHATKSSASISNLAQRVGCLSLASPLSPGGMKCDAHLGYFGDDPTLRLRLTEAGLDQLPEELRVAATWAAPASGKGPPWEIPLDLLPSDVSLASLRSLVVQDTCANAGVNAEIIKLTRMFFSKIFDNVNLIESELNPVGTMTRVLERN